MEGKYRYRHKNVYDLRVRDMVVRLWSVSGPGDRREISRMLDPLARSGFVHPYVALMPDWHPGEDALVGSVIPTREVILPGVVGGDIGCGVCSVRLPLDFAELRDKLPAIAGKIRERVPVGTSHNPSVDGRVEENRIWGEGFSAQVSGREWRKLKRQFASLGGGNHFLEIQRGPEGRLWVTLHSGSRYLGVGIRDHYLERGSREPGAVPSLYRRLPHFAAGTALADDYLADVARVVAFARESRREMMLRALEVFSGFAGAVDPDSLVVAAIEVSHNYVAREEHFGQKLYLHRKGAIRLPPGARGLVPGSMGTPSFLVEGRGNRYGFESCAHGGGRAMSRSVASRLVTHRSFRRSMEGIVCEHEGLLLDEAPEAYKDIRTVMRGQNDLVKTIAELEPVASIKGR